MIPPPPPPIARIFHMHCPKKIPEVNFPRSPLRVLGLQILERCLRLCDTQLILHLAGQTLAWATRRHLRPGILRQMHTSRTIARFGCQRLPQERIADVTRTIVSVLSHAISSAPT
ncbi:hypothetical protein M758_UG081200 [Ceratodon purpureus]|nr:hypothetical protein M758_UG081200 [Ceratodon purpureus]